MKDRGRVRTWIYAAAGLGVACAAVLGMRLAFNTKTKIIPSAKITSKSSLPEISKAIARGDGMALAVLKSRVDPKVYGENFVGPREPLAPVTEEQGAEFADALANLRVGFSRFSGYGRGSAVVVTSEILHKFDEMPAPAAWVDSLRPASEVFAAALVDQDPGVRAAVLGELKGFWNWSPQRELMTGEYDHLKDWKASLHAPVVARLNDREPAIRTSAVACLGVLHVDSVAQPAVSLITDPDGGVRLQVLISFADRPTLLTEESMLPLLYDSNPYIPGMAEQVLKMRGLTPELLGLSKLIVNPRPEMRMSAIPFLKDRHDIDPTVWLIYLSRDVDESVRLKAIDALAKRLTPEAKKRLSEMADSDASKSVREAAGKVVPDGESTADLPPLPSMPGTGMKLKAN